VAKQARDGDWKGAIAQDLGGQAPPVFVSFIMRNNFRTKQGGYVIVGLMGLPLWAWGQK